MVAAKVCGSSSLSEDSWGIDRFTLSCGNYLYSDSRNSSCRCCCSSIIDSTCNFFTQAFGSDLTYKSDIYLEDFSCNYYMENSNTLEIQFDILASFQKLTGFNPYTTNRSLPITDELNSSVKIPEGNEIAYLNGSLTSATEDVMTLSLVVY